MGDASCKGNRMKPGNKSVLFAMVSGAATCITASCALAQNYPVKTVRIVVPFAPGGHTDIIARILGQKYTETMRQPFVVDNRAGAGGVIGTDIVAKAAPDGHTLLVMPLPFAVLPSLYVKLPYDANQPRGQGRTVLVRGASRGTVAIIEGAAFAAHKYTMCCSIPSHGHSAGYYFRYRVPAFFFRRGGNTLVSKTFPLCFINQ